MSVNPHTSPRSSLTNTSLSVVISMSTMSCLCATVSALIASSLGTFLTGWEQRTHGTVSSTHSTYPWTDGTIGELQVNLVAGSEEEEEDHIEEIFGQLWEIPTSLDKPRVPRNGGHMFWIRSNLARERSFCPKDCFPVSRP
jgi:hypothetical protein